MINVAGYRSENPQSPSPNFGNGYFIGLGRAMVSLGPISASRYCPYRCRFCYVQGPFPKYKAAAPAEIVSWLWPRRSEFDIVYVSGDTDSFAAPRAAKALELLESLLQLNVDVLFTTRAVLSRPDENRLYAIAKRYRKANLLLVGCISVSQLHHPGLEPRPIPEPRRRLLFLRRMQKNGIVTALTIRPFIPTIPAEEYREIGELGHRYADVILGGDLYLDSAGKIAGATDQSIGNSEISLSHARHTALDFSLADTEWEIVSHPAAVLALEQLSKDIGKPFFMRSGEAIEWLRDRRQELVGR